MANNITKIGTYQCKLDAFEKCSLELGRGLTGTYLAVVEVRGEIVISTIYKSEPKRCDTPTPPRSTPPGRPIRDGRIIRSPLNTAS